MSKPALDSTIPVRPPMVNKITKPTAKSIAGVYLIEPPHKVAIQLNIFIPVGIAIIIVAAVK